MRYPITFMPDDNGTILVISPDFPEMTSFGDDEADATLHALDAVETAIQGRITDRREIPEPSASGDAYVVLPTSTALKVRLHRAMLATNTKKADLVRRLDLHPPQVDRLLKVGHETKLEQFDRAFRALGRELEVEDRRIA